MTNFKAEELNKPTAGSNATFQSVFKAKIPELLYASLVIKNVHATAALTYKILVSNDPEGANGTFAPLTTDAEGNTTESLAAGTLTPWTLSGPFVWIDVQIESEDANSPQASVWLLGVG